MGRWKAVVRTAVVVGVAAGVTLAAVLSGGRSSPPPAALGDAPAGLGAAPAVGPPLKAASRRTEDGPIVQTVTPTLSSRLRDLPPALPSTLVPADESNSPDLPAPPVPATQPHDPAVQSTPGLFAMPPPIATFEGLDNNDNPGTTLVIPPDTEGDIGPNHYVEWINIVFQVYDRAGAPLTAVVAGNALFAALPANNKCRTTNSGDPLVLYDQLADRWVVTQFTGSASPFLQCVAVSTTPDPTGTYCLYPFVVSTTVFNDYPKIGLRSHSLVTT